MRVCFSRANTKDKFSIKDILLLLCSFHDVALLLRSIWQCLGFILNDFQSKLSTKMLYLPLQITETARYLMELVAEKGSNGGCLSL